MSQKITLEGVGYGVSFIELSDSELEIFLEEMEDVDDATELKIVSDLVADSFYEYGLLLEDGDLLLEVDGEDKTNQLREIIANGNSSLVDLTDSNNSNWLYYEAKEKVKINIDVDAFDQKKIDYIKHEVMLPNKTTKNIISIYYADKGFDPWDTTSEGEVYIVKKSGEIVTF